MKEISDFWIINFLTELKFYKFILKFSSFRNIEIIII